MNLLERQEVGLSATRRVFHIALQPTSLCNLDCRYCYLPQRKARRLMSTAVAQRVSNSVRASVSPVRLVWHSGEPLACGIQHFRSLISLFGPTRPGVLAHSLQTNATLIDDRWCDLFAEYGVEVGISIDGTPLMNGDRRDWQGAPAYDRTMRGAEMLRKRCIPFGVIAVVTRDRLDDAALLYKHACDLGATILCVNIEETEGSNVAAPCAPVAVRAFWRDLYDAWSANPVLPIREFERPLALMLRLCDSALDVPELNMELFPCVSAEGDVVFLSPELADSAPHLVLGNVLESSLDEIVARSASAEYVAEYDSGLRLCRDTCEYFAVCGGGAASNRYFEHGRFDTSETECCRNRLKAPVDTLLERLTAKRGEANAKRS